MKAKRPMQPVDADAPGVYKIVRYCPHKWVPLSKASHFERCAGCRATRRKPALRKRGGKK